MKQLLRTEKLKTILIIILFACVYHPFDVLKAQVQVIVPNQIVPSDFASNGVQGWRLLSTGNSNAQLVNVSDFSIPASFGPHSVRAVRTGGAGLNRSFLGYFESGRNLLSLENVQFNRFSEQGNDSYLNIFITNGSAIATIVYQPQITLNTWQTFNFNSSTSGNISVRIGGTTTNLTYAQLINQYGNWVIYNHPNTIDINTNSASDFIGGIVLVSGSSSPTAPQTHTFDGVTIKFANTEAVTYDFVAPPTPLGCFATEVITYAPGKRKNGLDLTSERSIASNALFQPQNSDVPVAESEVNFVSLGFGGTLVLKMQQAIKNGPGNDLRVYETTYPPHTSNCTKNPERIKAFASQDGCNWTYLGEICQDGELDLGELHWALYFRFHDVSPISFFLNPNEDGYDFDGIECLNGYEENPVIQDLGAFYAMEYLNFNQGLRKNNSPVPALRSNPVNALFQPQNNNTINFVSLGFNGSIVLKLGYIVFNKPGIDFQVVETTFGNQTCATYPERVLIEVSLDNINYTVVGQYCLDANVDLGSIPYARYIRFTDRSNRSNFGATADGYDIDGVVVVNPGCTNGVGLRLDQQASDIELESEESVEVTLYPNPNSGLFQLNFINPTLSEMVTLSVSDISGRMVWVENILLTKGENKTQTIDLSPLSEGLYIMSVSGASGTESIRWVKQ